MTAVALRGSSTGRSESNVTVVIKAVTPDSIASRLTAHHISAISLLKIGARA